MKTNITVLVVEDKDFVGIALKRCLESMGYTVIWVQTFADGYRMIINHHHDLHAVMLDGELDGNKLSTPLVQLLKEHSFAGQIVAMSGKSEVNKILMSAGCTSCVPKPFTMEDLKETLKQKART